MATQKRQKKKKTAKKHKSNALVIWTIILISLIVIGYFTYPQLKPWFINTVNNNMAPSEKPAVEQGENVISTNVWVNELDGSMLSFKNNGSFTIDFPSVDQSRQINGTYQIQNNRLSIAYNKEIKECSGKEGIYNFSIKDKVLSFKEVDDQCSDRKNLMTAGWFAL